MCIFGALQKAHTHTRTRPHASYRVQKDYRLMYSFSFIQAEFIAENIDLLDCEAEQDVNSFQPHESGQLLAAAHGSPSDVGVDVTDYTPPKHLTAPDDIQISASTQAANIGPPDPLRVLEGSTKCAVTLSTKRGPAFTQVAVKLFRASPRDSRSKLEQLVQEKAEDSAVSCFIYF